MDNPPNDILLFSGAPNNQKVCSVLFLYSFLEKIKKNGYGKEKGSNIITASKL